jgi:hypothetical protein
MRGMTKYLATVPDAEQMTREYLANLIRKFRHHRSISFGFSKKHTTDIMEYRKQLGMGDESTIPGNLYSLPVKWNTDVTYIK